jgi:hypothetical protein
MSNDRKPKTQDDRRQQLIFSARSASGNGEKPGSLIPRCPIDERKKEQAKRQAA